MWIFQNEILGFLLTENFQILPINDNLLTFSFKSIRRKSFGCLLWGMSIEFDALFSLKPLFIPRVDQIVLYSSWLAAELEYRIV